MSEHESTAEAGRDTGAQLRQGATFPRMNAVPDVEVLAPSMIRPPVALRQTTGRPQEVAAPSGGGEGASPASADAVLGGEVAAPSGGDAVSPGTTPRHRRPGHSRRKRRSSEPSTSLVPVQRRRRARLVFLGAAGGAVLVAVPLAMATLRGQPVRDSAADHSVPDATNPAVPGPSGATDVPSPSRAARSPITSPPVSVAPTAVAPKRTKRGTASKPDTPSPSDRHWQKLTIRATYVLNPGGSVRTNRIRLTLQTNGDLVLRNERNTIVWSTGTRASGTHAVFQADGNFVLYSRDNSTLWSSRTDGHDGAILVLQPDGNMTILDRSDVLWATGTGE